MYGMEQRILKSAQKLFFEKGYSLVRMDDIAAYMGISKKTIYNHFQNKQEIYSRVIWDYAETTLKELETIVDDESCPYMEKVAHVLLFCKDRLRFTANIDPDSEISSENKNRTLSKTRDRLFPCLETLLKEGIGLGIVRPEIPVKTTIYVILALFETHFEDRKSFFRRNVPEDLADFVEQVLFQGMLTPGGIKELKNEN